VLILLRPRPRSKEFTLGDLQQRRTKTVGGVEWESISPPGLNSVFSNCAVLRILQTEEDQDGADGDTGIKSSGQDIVVLGPPREVTTSDDVLEDETNNSPWDVVDGTGRGDGASSAEDDGEVDVAHEAVGELLCQEKSENGHDEADEEEDTESIVDLALRELPSRSDNTPDNTGGTKYFGGRTDEAIRLVGVTHIRDVAEHPGLDTKLDGSGKHGGDDLTPEHSSRGDFHVVAELKVGRER